MNYVTMAGLNPTRTPQSQPIPGREAEMAPNDAGGVVFVLDDRKALRRFLILGTEGGTYYASEQKHTLGSVAVLDRCLDADPAGTVATIVEVSKSGAAPKNAPAVFAIARACAKKVPSAFEAVPEVCRTATDLFAFAEQVRGLDAWTKPVRRAIASWYEAKDAETLGYQLAKYQGRTIGQGEEGARWDHKRLLRMCHPKVEEEGARAALRWAMLPDKFGELTYRRRSQGNAEVKYRPVDLERMPRTIRGMRELAGMKLEDVPQAARLIADMRLPREVVPSDLLTSPAIWEALLPGMPMTALVRNLGTMTKVGLLAPLSDACRAISDRLRSSEAITKARIHPASILLALKTYASGQGKDATWTPVQQVTDALDGAFYLAFGNVQPTGKPTVIGIDVSGSMSSYRIGNLTCAEAAAAVAMVTGRVEPGYFIGGFHCGFVDLKIGARDSLPEVLRKTGINNSGGTDCAIPMAYALQNNIRGEAYQVLTDNETWCGRIHPSQALKEVRKQFGIPAKLAVLAFMSTNRTIADPADPGMMDFVGFDAGMFPVLHDFIVG